MGNYLTHKNLRCIKWTVLTPSKYNSIVVSDSFAFQDRQCRFQFCTGSEIPKGYESSLYFKSDKKLTHEISVTVRVFSTVGDLIYLFEKQNVKGGNQEIWRCENSRLLNTRLTFEVILHTEEKQQEIISGNQGRQMSVDSKKNMHLEALSRDYSKLFTERSNCDVEIACEGKTFYAHRIILETRSPVFSAMLKSNMIESNTGLIKIKDIDAPIFESFLCYLYSGVFPELSVDTAKQLYDAGDRYAMEELKKACSKFLSENLSKGNACEIVAFADMYNDEDLKSAAIFYIVESKVPQRDKHWSNFCKNHAILAVEIQNLYIQKYCPN